MRSSVEVAERLAAIVNLQQEILTAVNDPEAVIDLIVSRTPELTNGTGAVVEVVHGEDLVYRAASGTVSQFVGFHVPIDGSLSGLAVREKVLQRCDNCELDPRVDAEACRAIGLRSMIVAPLLHGNVVLGALKTASVDANAFRDLDAWVLQLLAGITSSAMVRAKEFREREASEQRYRMLFDRNVAGVFRSTTSGKILDCNDSLVHFLGYDSREDLMTHESWELYRERSDREAILQQLKQGAVLNTTVPFRKKDGAVIHGVVNMSIIPGDDGEAQLLGTLVAVE